MDSTAVKDGDSFIHLFLLKNSYKWGMHNNMSRTVRYNKTQITAQKRKKVKLVNLYETWLTSLEGSVRGLTSIIILVQWYKVVFFHEFEGISTDFARSLVFCLFSSNCSRQNWSIFELYPLRVNKVHDKPVTYNVHIVLYACFKSSISVRCCAVTMDKLSFWARRTHLWLVTF